MFAMSKCKSKRRKEMLNTGGAIKSQGLSSCMMHHDIRNILWEGRKHLIFITIVRGEGNTG